MKLMHSIHKYDVSLFIWLLNSRMHAVLSLICRYISKTGDGHLYLLLIGLLYYDSTQNVLLKTILLAFFIERPSYFLMKNGFKRNRPSTALNDFESAITPADQFSFPSGHTSAAFLIATLLGYFYPSLTPALLCWAALVGFSRVILGVHFPTDILFGVVLGISSATLSLELVQL